MVQINNSPVLAVLLTLFFLVPPDTIPAQQAALAAYLEGQVYLQEAQSGRVQSTARDNIELESVLVEIGDELPANGLLVLNSNSMLEIETSVGRILLTRPGRYELGAILHGSTAGATRELGTMVRTRVRSLSLEPPFSRTSAAAGVRGTEAGSSETASTWASGELVSELIIEALAYRDAGQYQTALATLEDAAALGAEGPEFTFYLGYLHYLNDNLSSAYQLLTRFAPVRERHYYPTHVLTLAQLHYDGFAFSRAVELLQPLVERQLGQEGDAEFEPLALLVLSLDAAGRSAEAAQYLARSEKGSDWWANEGAEQLRRIGAE